jgi:hypothetical protein
MILEILAEILFELIFSSFLFTFTGKQNCFLSGKIKLKKYFK